MTFVYRAASNATRFAGRRPSFSSRALVSRTASTSNVGLTIGASCSSLSKCAKDQMTTLTPCRTCGRDLGRPSSMIFAALDCLCRSLDGHSRTNGHSTARTNDSARPGHGRRDLVLAERPRRRVPDEETARGQRPRVERHGRGDGEGAERRAHPPRTVGRVRDNVLASHVGRLLDSARATRPLRAVISVQQRRRVAPLRPCSGSHQLERAHRSLFRCLRRQRVDVTTNRCVRGLSSFGCP